MRIVGLILGLCFPFFLCGQAVDSVALKKVDSLLLAARQEASKGKFDAALALNTVAENLALQKDGEQSITFGKSCFNRGRILYFQSNYNEAEKWYLKAKSIFEKILDKMDPYYASTLNNLALLYEDMGFYDKAELLYHQAIEIREKVLGKTHPDYIASRHNLANLYIESGFYEKAETLLLEVQSIREKVFGKNHLEYARGLNNLAVLYHFMGNSEKIEPFLLESLSIKEKNLGKETPEYARSLNNLANYYGDMGNYEKVELLYLEALAIRAKIQGKDQPDYAQSLVNLGVFYSDIGNNKKAESFLLEAMNICEKVFGKENSYTGMVIGDLATVYHSLGEHAKAEPLYLSAKNIAEISLGKTHPDYATPLMNLGAYYIDIKDYKKAEAFFVEAIGIREKALGIEHLSYAKSLNALAGVAWSLKKYAEANTYLQKAEAIEKKSLLKATRYLSEQELAAYIQAFQRSMNWNYSLKQQHQSNLASSYDNVLFYKGFLLNVAAKMRTNFINQVATNNEYQKLIAYQRRLAMEYSKPLADRQNVAELEEKANTLEKELTRTVAGFGEAIRQVTWREVQQKLKSNEAAIEFVHYQFVNPNPTDSIMYAALVLRPGMKQPVFIPLFEQKQLDTVLKGSGKTKTDYINQLYALGNQEKPLYQLIWKPLEQELIGATTIYFSPSGLLHRLNLNAIPVPIPTLAPNKTLTLADRYQLIELGSTRQLVIEAPKTEITQSKDAQIYGGIQYEMDSTSIKIANVDLNKNLLTARRGIDFTHADSTLRGGKWNYLKWTEVEINSLEAILTDVGMKPELHKGYTATEESFKRIGVDKPSPRIVHLATHGFFFPDPKSKSKNENLVAEAKEPVFKISEHPMIRSGLILAGGNHVWQTGKPFQPGFEDGILTAYEISQMNLANTELVVLSACETGLGDIQGNEGVYGLQRAFKIAGAKYLIMSLWQVPDFHTQELMTTFYSKWLEDKMSIPDAFRAAQKELKEKFKEPFYWAGFVLVE